jgi:signal transduction histidine kinase
MGQAPAGDRRAVGAALEAALGRRPSKRLAGAVEGCLAALAGAAGPGSTVAIDVVNTGSGPRVRVVLRSDRPVGDDGLTLARTVASSIAAGSGPNGPELELIFDGVDVPDPPRPPVEAEAPQDDDLRAVLARQTAQLRDLAAELAGANTRLEHFARLLAHDLKTPLSTIAYAAELLCRLGQTGRTEGLVGDIATAARDAFAMIDDILAYSQAGDLLIVPVALDDLVADVIESVRPSFDRAGGAIEVSVALPVVEGNATALRHVLTNLLINSLAYRDPGRAPHVTISVESVDGHWRLVIADNGVGVPDAHREAIFDAGVRLDDGVPGTGYGLAAARTLVERHGGRIRAAANPGAAGVQFLIDLPERPAGP